MIKKTSLYIFAGLVISLISVSSYAFVSRYSNWLAFDFTGSFSKGSQWHYYVMNEARIPTNPARLENFFLKPSMYYKFNNSWSFWLGYDLIQINPGRINSNVEQRVWPQVMYKKNLTPKIVLGLRTRYETRWLESKSDVATRLRQRFGLTFKGWNDKNISLSITEELLFGIEKPVWVSDESLDQFRTYIGLGIPLNHLVTGKIGYLNLVRPRTPRNRYEHVLVATLSVNVDKGGV